MSLMKHHIKTIFYSSYHTYSHSKKQTKNSAYIENVKTERNEQNSMKFVVLLIKMVTFGGWAA